MTSLDTFAGLEDSQPWSDWLRALRSATNHIDPYMVWSLQTAFRQHLRQGMTSLQWMDFLVELDTAYNPANSELRSLVPSIYETAMPGSDRRSRHITVRMPFPSSMAELASSIWWLALRPQIRRAQIGFPRAAFPGEVAPPEPPPPLPPRQPPPAPKVMLGLLEDGCPFGHAALTAPWGTRVVALWDQSLTDEATDAPPSEFGYGRVREHGELQALIDRHTDAYGIDEQALYDDPRSLQPGLRDQGSHAAAVTLLMAGRRDRMPSHPRHGDDPQDSDQRPHRRRLQPRDGASEAPVAVVQFPREQIDIAGARWLVVRALDGLRFLAEASQQHATSAQPLPLVVNISYGSVVGGHDGSATLETAIAELAEAHGNLAVVLAAGNSHGTQRDDETLDVRQRLPSGRHAERKPLPPGSATTLRLYVPPGKPIETYLEIWFDVRDVPPDERFLEIDEVTVEVTSPTGAKLKIERVPDAAFDDMRPRYTGVGLIAFPRVAQSLHRSMVLLVVASTQVSSRRVEVSPGVWSLRVLNKGARTLEVEAWVERDIVPRSRTTQAARLLRGDKDDLEAAALTDENTLNNIATGPQAFRVGALTWLGRDTKGRPTVSPYSSAAAPGKAGPEFSAFADMSPALPGLRVSGNTSAAVMRMNGTSVAAPQASRWIANRLAAGQTLERIRRVIERRKGDSRRGRVAV